MNKINFNGYKDELFLAGELVKVFCRIKTNDENRSLHLHNEIIERIFDMVGEEHDIELRVRIAKIIIQLGFKNEQEESTKEVSRRTIKK